MLAIFVSMCTLIVTVCVLFIVGSLRWKTRFEAIHELKEFNIDLKVFVMQLKEMEDEDE